MPPQKRQPRLPSSSPTRPSPAGRQSCRTSEASAADAADRLAPALYAIARQVGVTTDPRQAMAAILRACVAAFGADAGGIAILDADTRRLQIEVQTGLPADVAEHTLRLGQGLTGWAALQVKPVLAADVAADPRYIAVLPGVQCEMAAPLEIDGQALGAITLDATTVGAFSPADLADFARLAAEAARTLQRIWLFGTLQAKARQLETLTVVGQSLVAKLQLQELLDTVSRETRAIFGSRICAILLHQPATGTLRAESWAGPEGFIPPAPCDWALDDCLAAAAVRTAKQVEFPNVHGSEFLELRDIPREVPVQSVLFSPLIADGALTGVLASYGERAHRHTNDEKRLLNALANLGAVAIANSRLYARVFSSEETLRKNETLTTLGLLAAEIAHEVRNPLTVIKLLYGSLGLEFPAGDPRSKDTRIIGEKLNQLEATVTRVLNLAKAPAALYSRWPLDEIVGDTVLLVRLKLHQGRIAIRYEPARESLVLDANKGQLQQVLLNLILNSMHAMSAGGRITLRAARITREDGTPAVELDCSDTGCGIPPHLQPRLFDSFLTGRSDGTGLGLAIVQRILKSHHGYIVLVSTGPQGTTFRITLPLAPAP